MAAQSITSLTEPRSMRLKREVEDHNPSAKASMLSKPKRGTSDGFG